MLQWCFVFLPESLTHHPPVAISTAFSACMSCADPFHIPQVCVYKSFSHSLKSLRVFTLCNGETLGSQLPHPSQATLRPSLDQWTIARICMSVHWSVHELHVYPTHLYSIPLIFPFSSFMLSKYVLPSYDL